MGKGGFGGFGGGFNPAGMQNLMKQAQKMQEDLKRAEEELNDATVEGAASGGLVRVTVNGKKEVQGITIDKNAVDPDDVEMLEDLVMAAIHSAYEKADELSNDKLGAFKNMGGLI